MAGSVGSGPAARSLLVTSSPALERQLLLSEAGVMEGSPELSGERLCRLPVPRAGWGAAGQLRLHATWVGGGWQGGGPGGLGSVLL